MLSGCVDELQGFMSFARPTLFLPIFYVANHILHTKKKKEIPAIFSKCQVHKSPPSKHQIDDCGAEINVRVFPKEPSLKDNQFNLLVWLLLSQLSLFSYSKALDFSLACNWPVSAN